MKVSDVRSDDERAILTALLVHDDVLATVHTKLGEERGPFENKWSNIISQWCRAYFEKYHKSPRKHIKQLFDRYAEKVKDEDVLGLIESFLARLSKDHAGVAQELNVPYVLDQASHYFERVRLSRYTESLQTALENRDLEEARKVIGSFKTVDFSSTAWKDPFSKETVQETLRYYEQDKSLLHWPGALDKFLSPFFERDGFISFIAPEKRGKSWWLLEVVYQALRQRRKVVYYGFGDMSENQMNRRLYTRATRLPMATGDFKIPISIRPRKEGLPKVEFKEEERRKFTVSDVEKAVERLKQVTASKQLQLKLRCAGAGVSSAGEMEQELHQFAKAGWVPDVVVLDYADLVAPEGWTKTQDVRHQMNESWKIFRRISLDLHCLFVTATQGAATSYDARLIRKKDFSEDKRKNAHVTGMLGINQTSEEKEFGLYRLNWTFLRDGAWADHQSVWTAGCLGIGCPCILSSF